MSTPAKHPPSPIAKTLSQPLARPVKTIVLNAAAIRSTPMPKRLRNASVGMAIAYSDNVGAHAHPVLFLARNLGPLLASFAHLLIPLAMAWFASHWSVGMEDAIWAGSTLSKATSFAALWVVALLAWSICWISFLGICSRVARIGRGFADVGEDYLVSKKSQGRPEAGTDA